MADNMFDILMEIRKVDMQVSELKLKIQQSQQEVRNLEKNINNVKVLQLKALSILKDTERKFLHINNEIKSIHKTFDTLIEYYNEYIEIVSDNEQTNISSTDELRKQRDNLIGKLIKARVEKEEIARKVNNVDLQISIQKKKNAAVLLRLQKNLEESLQEEKNLLDMLK